MFRESLMKVVDNVEGGVAGLLMGFDGIAVDTYRPAASSFDINTIGMEFSFILGQVRKAAEVLEVGGVQEVAIRAEQVSIIVRILSHDYFIALALAPQGNFGKGRFLLRQVAPQIQNELA